MVGTDHSPSASSPLTIRKGKLFLTREPMEYFPETEEGLEQFVSSLEEREDIHYVLLERRFVRNLSSLAWYAAILQGICRIPNLTELEIWSVRVPLTLLCQALPCARKLVRLGLGMVTLTLEHEEEYGVSLGDNCSALAHHPNLQSFYLSDFRVLIRDDNGDDETEGEANGRDYLLQQELEEEAPSNGTTTTTDLQQSEPDQHNQRGQPVSFRQKSMIVLDSFWAALSTCPRLLNVEVFSKQSEHLPWTPRGLAYLAQCPRLEQLTLRRLKLTHEDIAPFAHQLLTHECDMTTTWSPLRVLNMHQNELHQDGCLAIARAVAASRTIRELDLRDNHLSIQGSLQVIPLLLMPGANHSLEKVNLASNAIGDEGAQLVAELLEQGSSSPQSEANVSSCRLKHLDLSRAQLTDNGCSRLAQALTVNATLLSLNVAYNQLTNRSYVAFGEALRTSNRTLVSLNLQVDRRKIDSSGCQALLRMVEDNYVLETVSTLLGARGYDPTKSKSGYAYYIRLFLRLNHAGRQKLLEQRGTKADWIHAMAAVQDSLHAIYYLLSANPSLCNNDPDD